MLEEVEQVVEGSREDNGAIPVEKVKDRTREVEVRGLNHLSAPELEDRIDGEDNLEEWECLSGRMIFKDVLTPYGEEGDKFRSIGEEIRTVESGMGEGGWDIGCSMALRFLNLQRSRVGSGRGGFGKVK